MKKITQLALVLGVAASGYALASPEADRAAFQNFYEKRFPQVTEGDFINGVYSILPAAREQWEAIEEFPPYEVAIEDGEELYNTVFANGKSLADCFDTPAQRENYPYWDADRGKVVTMEMAINECRVANGEKPYKTKKGALAAVSAYMSYESRGQMINVQIPADDAGAMAAYNAGKEVFYTKRGQLNFACSDCHMYGSGLNARADTMSPAFGHASHWPVYRSKWQAMGTLHRRFAGCMTNVRAKPFRAQGTEYANLEYFLTYMSNGLEFNGPGARK